MSSSEHAAPPDLDAPELYLNRELGWLRFNRRVLAEAVNEANPLLERVKFFSIFHSNLDEFFMKRIGRRALAVDAGVERRSPDGRNAREEIAACRSAINDAWTDRDRILATLLPQLREAGMVLAPLEELPEAARERARTRLVDEILPLVTPLAIDAAHPFPFISNLSLSLLVELDQGSGGHFVRIKVPSSDSTPRFLQVSSEHFVALEDVIAGNLDLVVPGARVKSWTCFRVTRNAIVESNEDEADDVLERTEEELRQRKFAPVVRLQLSAGTSDTLRRTLLTHLDLSDEENTFEVERFLAAADFMELFERDRPELKYDLPPPTPPPRLQRARDLYLPLRTTPILIQRPYESFDASTLRLLREAARDPAVLGIKTTIYRTSEESEIVHLLVEAARAGKQVAALVELKARFDEAANIHRAMHLEKEGIHVAYGVSGLKTHVKAMSVVRRGQNGTIERFVHLGTGNYHPVTARLYADLDYLTTDPVIAEDVGELFNAMTSGCLAARRYQRLLVAPHFMKEALLAKIERERRHAEAGRTGWMQLKCNALEDVDITRALYRAAAAGAKIDLLIRDSCRLRPGIPGLTEEIRVVSVVGPFLEHARVYRFHNDGDDEWYIGSADLMSRNLDDRVEVLVPIDDAGAREALRHQLETQLKSPVGTWQMNDQGHYTLRGEGPLEEHPQVRLLRELCAR